MNIAVIGSGYVGLVTGVGFASLGHSVTCIDVSKEKVDSINKGIPPIFEEGLQPLLQKVLSEGTFSATISYSSVRDADIALVCVGTPSAQDGGIDLTYVRSAIESIGREIASSDRALSVVIKSTVVPGTTRSMVDVLAKASGKSLGVGFGMGMVPEFLKEGTALNDFLSPDRLVLGSMDDVTRTRLRELHASFACPTLEVDPTTAEMVKYASNSFLAMKVTYANEMANYAQRVGVHIDDVMKGVGLDDRIGPKFLVAGIGFGGSCFTKDMRALAASAKEKHVQLRLLECTLAVNESQPLKMMELATHALSSTSQGKLDGKIVAVLGLAFKPGTDDVRESPSIVLVRALVESGAIVRVFDPQAMENARLALGSLSSSIEFCTTISSAADGAQVLFLATNWPEFRKPIGEYAAALAGSPPVIVDAWRMYTVQQARETGVAYASIGGPQYYGQD